MDEIDYASIVKNPARREWILPKVIGVGGLIGHGKSTIAELLRAKFSYVRIGFSDHLRVIASELVGIPSSYVTDRTFKTLPVIKLGGASYAPPRSFGTPQVMDHLDTV